MDRSYRVGKLKQHVDNKDPGISLKALDQSWRLDGAYQEERPLQTITIHELKIEAEALSAIFHLLINSPEVNFILNVFVSNIEYAKPSFF